MISVDRPGSPGWWFNHLHDRLTASRDHYQLLDDHYTGEAAAPVMASTQIRQAYQRLMSMARTNFAELVVEAVRERMTPVAFRTGVDGDENGDAEALRIWQANALDADSALVHRASLSMGMGYVIVGPVDDETGAPVITVEDPREVVAVMDPQRRRKVRAALKMYVDPDTGVGNAYLYLPGQVYRAQAKPGVMDRQLASFEPDGWDWVGEGQRLPIDAVPVVPFPNRANSYGRSFGEFETHIAVLARINYQILQRLEIATLQAFRQRAIKGVPNVDEDGEPVDYSNVFESSPGSFWLLPPEAELWESGVVDLNPIRQAIRDDVQDLAAVTRTPLFYLSPEAANGSAEGASLAREGLVFKTKDRIGQATESWEQVLSLAFQFAGDNQRASRQDIEVLWLPPERFSLAERYDAASKASAAGVPWREIMSDVLQFSPQAVERMQSERAGDALLTAALNTPSVPRALPVAGNA